MFQGLRQNSLFYILDKGGEKPTLRIGQVISVSDPQQKFPTTYIPNQVPNFDTTVDVKVKVGEQQLNFEKLPSTAQIANSGTNGVVVSDSRDAMCAEVDSMLRQAKGILESVDYNKAVVESCDEILAKLNPQIAKCYKVFNYYQVNPELKRTCDKSKDYPNTTYQVETYTQSSTPMSFKNRIAYGFTKNEVADKHIDNDFWISGITNYSQKAATENYKDKTECYGIKSSEKGKRFKIGTPSKFYKLYTDEGVGGYGIYSK